MYVVFEDLEKASANPKIHQSECRYYRRWLENPTITTTWHGPYDSEEEAWKICNRIAKRTGKRPSRAGCCF